MSELIHERLTKDAEWFKRRSLEALKENLASHHYPGYPWRRLTMNTRTGIGKLLGRWHLPIGEWDSGHFPNVPSEAEIERLSMQGYTLDTYGRPVHPWLEELLQPDIGVVTGKGFYRNWGANRTADPILIRTDLDEPHVLLIQRKDTGMWALPGGFIEPGEPPLEAALREAHEETLIDWRWLVSDTKLTYQGPLADIRTTAHAWPETSAFSLLLDPRLTAHLPVGPLPGDTTEVNTVMWQPLAAYDGAAFGSHRLLLELAHDQL